MGGYDYANIGAFKWDKTSLSITINHINVSVEFFKFIDTDFRSNFA